MAQLHLKVAPKNKSAATGNSYAAVGEVIGTKPAKETKSVSLAEALKEGSLKKGTWDSAWDTQLGSSLKESGIETPVLHYAYLKGGMRLACLLLEKDKGKKISPQIMGGLLEHAITCCDAPFAQELLKHHFTPVTNPLKAVLKNALNTAVSQCYTSKFVLRFMCLEALLEHGFLYDALMDFVPAFLNACILRLSTASPGTVEPTTKTETKIEKAKEMTGIDAEMQRLMQLSELEIAVEKNNKVITLPQAGDLTNKIIDAFFKYLSPAKIPLYVKVYTGLGGDISKSLEQVKAKYPDAVYKAVSAALDYFQKSLDSKLAKPKTEPKSPAPLSKLKL